MSQQQIAKLEDPDENPSIETLAKVGAALGLQLHIGFERADEIVASAARAARRAVR